MLSIKKEYIIFVDPEVERICMANWSSDGIGVTKANLAAVTSSQMTNKFENNTTILTFDEFQYFTGITRTWYSGSNGVFRGNTAMTNITIPSTLTYIDRYAFYNCASLADINLHSGITVIDVAAFSYCTSLEIDINLPNLTSLSGGSFYASGITSITSLGSVTSIPGSNTASACCFDGCTKLESVVLPSTLTSIGNMAFRNCAALESITWPSPNNIASIGQYAFYECPNLSGVVDLPSLTSIGVGVFRGSAITQVTSLGNITVISGATAESGGVFNRCTSLTSVVLPNTLITIGQHSFSNCSNLETVTWPTSNTFTTIGGQAFLNCVKLMNVPTNQAITTIGTSAFNGCTSLTGVVNYPNLTSIGYAAFKGTAITQVTSLGSITSLYASSGNGMFMNCTSLTYVVLPSTLTYIGRNCFQGCTSLQTVVFPNSAVSIPDYYAFQGCSSLTSLGIEQPIISSLGRNAFSATGLVSLDLSRSTFTGTCDSSNATYGSFYNCPHLTSIILPSTCTLIGMGTFNRCTSLASCNFDYIVTVQPYGFNDTVLSGDCTFPSMTSVGSYGFASTKISKLYLPVIQTTSGTSSAYSGSFSKITTLTYVDIGPDITSIGQRTFQGCSGLATIVVRATTVPTLGGSAFGNTNSTFKIYVPYSSDGSILNAYKAATNWSSYAARIFELDANGNIPT